MRNQRLRKYLRRLAAATSGVALTEFAVLLPVFLGLGLVGVDTAYLALVNMEISQTALSLADNASRLGQSQNSSVTPTVTETDVDSIMSGALRQGDPIDLRNSGKLILSSFEHDDASGRNYIHWQRCRGTFSASSAYGNDSNRNGLSGSPITGVGGGATRVAPDSGSAIMVAEIYYNYRAFFPSFVTPNRTLRKEAVFVIRDDRNLTPGLTGTRSSSSTC